MSRRGFSLVEAGVFGLIGVVVFGILLATYRSTVREGEKTQLHLRGLQAVYALLERLSADLDAGIFLSNPVTDQVFSLDVAPHGRSISFYRFGPSRANPTPTDGAGELLPLPAQLVRYAFAPATGRVTVTIGHGKEEPILATSYRSVTFLRAESADLTPEATALGIEPADLLRVKLQWIPEELRSRPSGQTGEVLSLVVTFPLRAAALMRREPFRIFNPTSKIGPEGPAIP